MNTEARQTAIYAVGLRKAFGEKAVLDGIDLDVPRGTVFALLGPNGAGLTGETKSPHAAGHGEPPEPDGPVPGSHTRRGHGKRLSAGRRDQAR